MLPCFRVSVLPCHRVSVLPCFHVSVLPCFRVTVFPCFCVTVLPCFRVSMFPCFRVTMSPRFRVSVLPSTSVLLTALLFMPPKIAYCPYSAISIIPLRRSTIRPSSLVSSRSAEVMRVGQASPVVPVEKRAQSSDVRNRHWLL